MHQALSTPFQEVLDRIEALSPEDQQAVIEVIQRRLIEQRRAEIARNAVETRQAMRKGRACCGTVDDLRRDFTGER